MSAFRTNLRYLSGSSVPANLAAAGGTYLVRGEELKVLEENSASRTDCGHSL